MTLLTLRTHRNTCVVSHVQDPSQYLASCCDQDTLLIADSFFKDTELIPSECRSIFITPSEQTKDLRYATDLLIRLHSLYDSFPTKIISIGGGILQDVSGFIAGLLRRGTPWTYIPTTLVSQADSCIGSKISINIGTNKNQVGIFYPPSQVVLSPYFLNTITLQQSFSGLGEILHYLGQKFINYTTNKSLLSVLSSLQSGEVPHIDHLYNLTKETLAIKKEFIQLDEFDTNLRKCLNYGHTFGHAIEAASKYRIPHGISVLLGLKLATTLTNNPYSPTAQVHFAEILDSLLLALSTYLFTEPVPFCVNTFLSACKKDKKNTSPTSVNIIVYSPHTSPSPLLTDLAMVSFPVSTIKLLVNDFLSSSSLFVSI